MTDFHIIQLNGGKQKKICPMFEKGIDYGIRCDLCQRWYQFGLKTLSDDGIDKFQDANFQYHCFPAPIKPDVKPQITK